MALYALEVALALVQAQAAAAPAPASPAVKAADVATTVTAAREPALDRWWLLGDAVVRGVRRGGRARRHAALHAGTADDTTTVRVGRRHARLLLACGCASAAVVVDSDEIVE